VSQSAGLRWVVREKRRRIYVGCNTVCSLHFRNRGDSMYSHLSADGTVSVSGTSSLFLPDCVLMSLHIIYRYFPVIHTSICESDCVVDRRRNFLPKLGDVLKSSLNLSIPIPSPCLHLHIGTFSGHQQRCGMVYRHLFSGWGICVASQIS
jgi:hypothetical protein